MRKRRREYPLPHYGQIVTTRHTIKQMINDIDHDVAYNTAVLIALEREHREYNLYLYSICSKLSFLSKLVYRCEGGYKAWSRQDEDKMTEIYGNDITSEQINEYMKNRKGFSKLPEKEYDSVFTNFLEYSEEAEDRLKAYNKKSNEKIEITQELLDYIIKCKKIIAPICARLIAVIDEQFSIGEYAYVFDYVLKKKGKLPVPEFGPLEYRMDKHDPFFPSNYEGFDIAKGVEGIFNEFDTDIYWR